MAIKIKVTAYGKPRSENGKVTGMGTAKVTTHLQEVHEEKGLKCSVKTVLKSLAMKCY